MSRGEVTADMSETAESASERPYVCVLAAWHGHEAELRGFLINRVGDQEAADDLLQEVFVRAMHEGEGFCRLDNPRAWLFRVTRNAAVDLERRHRPTDALPDQVATEEHETPPVDALSACLERNLGYLSERDAEVIRYCDLAGWPHKRYAEAAELSINAVKTRLFRARQRLREQLIHNCRVRFDEQGRVCCHLPRESANE